MLVRVKPLEVYIAGCASGRLPGEGASSAATEAIIFVAAVKRHKAPFRELWDVVMQQAELELRTTLAASVSSRPCALQWLLSCVVMRCVLDAGTNATAEANEWVTLRLQTPEANVSMPRLQLRPAPRFVSGAQGFLCVSNAVNRPIVSFDWERLVEWRRSWAAVGFEPSVLFAREAEQCAALTGRGVALHCEPRRRLLEVPHGNHTLDVVRTNEGVPLQSYFSTHASRQRFERGIY
jgi:hypothetical protein